MCTKIEMPSKETLVCLYKDSTISKIAQKFNTSRPTAKKWLKYYNIDIKIHKEACGITKHQITKIESHNFLDNEENLKVLYIDKRMSKEAIARLANCSSPLVVKYIDKFNLEKEKKDFRDEAIKKYILGSKMADIEIPKPTLSRWMAEDGIETRESNSYNRSFIKTSAGQQQIINFIRELGFEVLVNNRTLIGKELDIVVPSKNFAIEYNGVYYHSEIFKDKEFHIGKTNLCLKNNIDLMHIFEDQWKEKSVVLKSMIKNRLGISKKIHARKCSIAELNANERSNFFEKNHLQGRDQSKYQYGLIYDNALVSCMSFRKPRYNKNYDYELIRYANLLDHTVVGGFSKLLNQFRKNHNGSIISYSDIGYTTGKVYEKNGFVCDGVNKPNYWYVTKNGKRIPRTQITKRYLISKGFSIELTEKEICQSLGLLRIWDCGTIRWVLKSDRS